MAPPSKNFTIIADGAIDADSPITADLMEDLRDNDIHLEEWLGLDYTAAQNHDHDATNSKAIDAANLTNKSGLLSTLIAQRTFAMNSGTWSFSTGSLGFDPVFMLINWVALPNSGGLKLICGWGKATSDTNETGTSFNDTSINVSVSSTAIMGFSVAAGLSATFATEQAGVTAWGSSNITVSTLTGAWSSTAQTGYANILVVGG